MPPRVTVLALRPFAKALPSPSDPGKVKIYDGSAANVALSGSHEAVEDAWSEAAERLTIRYS